MQILSKFWGDEVEEDNTKAIVSDFEQYYPSLYESTNAEKKKKHMSKVKPASFNLARMRTRAQKATFKIDLVATL